MDAIAWSELTRQESSMSCAHGRIFMASVLQGVPVWVFVSSGFDRRGAGVTPGKSY
jgi:hypothetical protein